MPQLMRLLRREPGVAITFAYVAVAMAGIFYDERYYAQFGIPVMTLSQISDFLVAGIQQPVALLLVLSTLPMCWLADYFNMRSRRKHAAELGRLRAMPALTYWQRLRLRFLDWRVTQHWYSQLSFLVVILVYSSMFISRFAEYRADGVRRGQAPQVRVWLNGDANALAPTKAPTWTYLGAVGGYVFVYDSVAERSVVLPVNNIARIEPTSSRAALPGPILVPIP